MIMEANLFISTSNNVASWFKKKKKIFQCISEVIILKKIFSEDLFIWGKAVYLFIDLDIIWLNYRKVIIVM